jgi:HK97 family phage portal protein
MVQYRDPRAATVTPVQRFWMRRAFNWSARTAITEALYSNIYVYACARARALDLSSLPLRVGADPDKPSDFDKNHPLAKILGPTPGKPNMQTSARRLIQWASVQFDVTGRWGWEIASPTNDRKRRDNVPFELWPLPASRLCPVQSRGGADWWEYFEFDQGTGSYIRLTNDQVCYVWRPGQEDWREPESLLRAAGLNVSIAVMQDRYDYAFLMNDARPAAVVVHEAFNRKSERNSFRKQFLERHQGADNAGKVAFVEADRMGAMPKDSLFIQTLGLSQRDAEFIERYENQIRAICVALATPLSRLADSSRRTYANAERETLNYWRNAIKTQAVEMSEGIATELLPRLNDNNNTCWFDITGVPELEPPRRFAVGDIPNLLTARVINRNEARAGIYLGPVPGGEEFESLALPAPSQPLALEPAPQDRMPSISMLEAITADCETRASYLATRMIGSLTTRLTQKRGRQALDRGDTAWEMLDQAYWFDVACVEFAAWARTVAVAACVDARVPYTGERVDNWSQRWGHALADRWMTSWRYAMDVPGVVIDEVRASTVGIDPVVTQTLWVSARSSMNDDMVPLESVTELILKLHSGELSPQDALLQLG